MRKIKSIYNYDRFKDLKNKSGIYIFTNTTNNKVYIGRSIDIYRRVREHFRHSNNINNKMYFSHFYKALRFYDYNIWTVDCIAEITDIKEMKKMELYYIKLYNSVESGYNSTYKTDSGPIKIGEDHVNSLLKNEDVYFIREQYKNIQNPNDIYSLFKDKISYCTFLNIWRGNSWKSIHMDVYTDDNKKMHFITGNKEKIYRNEAFKQSRDVVLEVRKFYAEEKLTFKQVYEMYNYLNINTFCDIWYGKTFQDLITEDYLKVKQRGRKYLRIGNNKGKKNEDNF